MRDVKFLKSAKAAGDYPQDDHPEVSLMGRSNAGKSSFLNALCRQKVAKVSQAPGKTRLLNFFDVGEYYRLVDMPGYGFASRAGGERMSWAAMIETYVAQRENLRGALLIMDIRRDWSSDEEMVMDWLQRRGLPLCVLLNKGDKLNRGALARRHHHFDKTLPRIPKFIVSALERQGIDEVEEFVFRTWIQSKEQK